MKWNKNEYNGVTNIEIITPWEYDNKLNLAIGDEIQFDYNTRKGIDLYKKKATVFVSELPKDCKVPVLLRFNGKQQVITVGYIKPVLVEFLGDRFIERRIKNKKKVKKYTSAFSVCPDGYYLEKSKKFKIGQIVKAWDGTKGAIEEIDQDGLINIQGSIHWFSPDNIRAVE